MKRLILAPFLLLFVLLCALGAGAVWLVNTEEGLKFALNETQAWLRGNTTQQLEVKSIQGTLWQGVQLGAVRWKQGETEVYVEQFEFQAAWAELAQRKLVIRKLSAQLVQAQVPPSESDEPLSLPEQIELPFDIELQQLKVAKIMYNGHELNAMDAKARVEGGRLDVERFVVNAQDTQLTASLGLTLAQPYKVDALVAANRSVDELVLDAKLEASGSLERLELSLDAAGKNTAHADQLQSVQAQAILTLFKPALVETITVQADRFNPADWIKGAPRASFSIHAQVRPNSDFSQSVGEISVRNAQPFSVQSGGVPIASMQANFELLLNEQLPKQFDLQLGEISFADSKRKAGNATANLQWRAPAPLADGKPNLDLTAGDAQFNIQTRNVDASVFANLPQRLALTASIEGSKNGQQLRLSRLNIKDRQAELNGKLLAVLSGRMPLDFQLDLTGINPGNYIPDSGPLLQGKLNGGVLFKGELAPGGNSKVLDPFGQFVLNLDNSTLANAPLKLKAQFDGGLSRLTNVLLDLDVVGNTVHASGSYGTDTDFIQVDVNLDELVRLGKLVDMRLAGTARVQGKLQGIRDDFSGDGNIDIHQLKLDDTVQIEKVSGEFKLGSSPTSPWVGNVVVSKVKLLGSQANTVDELTLALRGVRNQHELKGVFSSGLRPFSRNRPLKGEFAFGGGVKPIPVLKAALGWQGALTALKVEGLWLPARSLTLQGPAPLTMAAGHIELLDLEIKGEDTSLVRNKTLRVSNREIQIEGEMPQFAFPRMSPILRKQLTVEPKDLIAAVRWRYLANANKVDGHVDLTHVSGGLQLLEDSQVDVNIRNLTTRLDFDRHAASLDLNVLADDFGAISANLRVPVEQNPQTKAWSLAGNQAMQGSVAAGLTNLSWLGPLISGGVRTSGTGQVAMAIGGTPNKPDVQGRLFGMGLDVYQLDQGVRLEDGNVVVDFTTDQASIDTFEFTVYNRQPPRRYIEQLGPLIQGVGKISAQGAWNLTGLDGEIRLNLDKVPLLQRADRWMMINSSVLVQQPAKEGDPLKIRGELNTLGAYFEMPKSGPQTLSDDVFIQGRSEVSGPGLPIDMQITANLGERFYVNAEGLKARLDGGLRLVMQDGVGGSGQRRSGRRLSATGTIQAVDGTYRAYGQDLSIERGVVNFQGPLDNPGLNVRAVRKGVAVEAGVAITGTAQRPKVALVSEPAVPDSEKLSWMILGRGSGSADRDATLLLTAAAAIFGNEDESTTRKIAKSLGIDDLTLSTGSLTAADSRAVGSKVAISPGADASASIVGSDDPLLSQRIVSLGKRFNDRLYLSFDQSVTTAASILKLNYQYSRRLSFIARAGADNALDVLYQFSFD